MIIELSVFFFSSRRRHTRFDCDWSSDVCSSDLKRQVRRRLEKAGRQRMESRGRYLQRGSVERGSHARGRLASALSWASASSPASSFGKAAAAIIAALSVESWRLGKKTSRPRELASS